MSNIFKDFVKSAPVKTPLDFGYNENIVIESIDFGVRKRNGIAINANTFTKLTKLDTDTKKAIANTEVSFWNLDSTKEFTKDNFMSQFSILAGIIGALDGDLEKYEADVMAILSGDSSSEFLIKFLKKADNAKNLQEALVKSFQEQVDGKIGLTSKLLKCKMVSNKSGFLEPADDISWILPMDSEEHLPVVTSREKAIRQKALETDSKKVSPDKTGEAPSGEAKITSKSSLDSL